MVVKLKKPVTKNTNSQSSKTPRRKVTANSDAVVKKIL